MGTDWLNSQVSRAEWLPGRAAWTQRGWPPDESSVFGAGIGLGSAGFWPAGGNEGSQAQDVVRTAIRSGIRVMDTATNYGHGFAEVAIGAAFRAAVLEGVVRRDDVAVISKAGYRPEGATGSPLHSIEPAFLRREIDASRRRMGLYTIDAYLLHNLEEQMVGGGSGWAAVPDALGALEAATAAGDIGCYGVAAAEGFLEDYPGFHSLERLLECARQAGGVDHRFRVVELPVSLWRREAFSTTPYTLRGSPATLLELAREAGLVVLASIPMGHGRDGRQAADFLRALFPDTGIESPAMMALQFARSAPGVHAALPGISTLAHLVDAIELTRIPRWNLEAVSE
jgi:aryl-alcohol dehydrogenase-like predicted oxidoreductase